MLCRLFFVSRRLSSSVVDLYTQIKQLNDAKQFRQAIALFNSNTHHQTPTDGTIHQALKACVEVADLSCGSDIHRRFSAQSTNNSFIQMNLIRLYMKCGRLREAQEIFDKSANKSSTLYDAMLDGLVNNNRAAEALELFRQMTLPATEYTFSVLFKVCARLTDNDSIKFGKTLLETMPVKYRNHSIVLNSALNMLMQHGDLPAGEQLFSRMKKNMKTYGAMMSGYITNNKSQQAIDLFLTIDKPDQIHYLLFFNACAQLRTIEALSLAKKVLSQLPVEYNLKDAQNKLPYAILDMFIKCSDIQSAEKLFAQLHRNVISYGSMMKFYNDRCEPEKTLTLFEQMQGDKVKSDEIISTLLFDACSHLGDLSVCESIVSRVPQSSLTNVYTQTALIDMWGKAGSVQRAADVFAAIPKPEASCFAAMINSYGLNGMGIESVELFRRVPREKVTETINVCVLNACSHSGLIDTAQEIFDNIPVENKTAQIYTTMVDALSRSSFVHEAQELISKFEQSHSPYAPMYMAILSAARNLRNVSLAQKIFDRFRLCFPTKKDYLIAAMVLLANTYARSGDLSTASDIRLQLGLRKKAGLSRTVAGGGIAIFRAHDRSHPRTEEIYAEIESWTDELIKRGYKSDPAWITRHTTNDESADSILCGHSERLAIAFNLIQRPVPSRIQVVKNLRICGDCHEVTKLLAQIRQCLIIVRDANRIHHFYPTGQCSCRDHF